MAASGGWRRLVTKRAVYNRMRERETQRERERERERESGGDGIEEAVLVTATADMVAR